MKIFLISFILGSTASAFDIKYTKENIKENSTKEYLWKGTADETINLMAQPMITPKPAVTTTPVLKVKALHDDKYVAIRLTWDDTEISYSERTGQYSDAVAVQFPVNGDQATPIFMGSPDTPVHIYHWRSQYQLDKDKGKRDIKDIYPNVQVDMYPMEFADKGKISKISETELEKFNPAIATGNPQSYPKTKGMDEILAMGFGTSSVREVQDAFAHGEWKNGKWVVTIVRPLQSKDASQFVSGKEQYMAFAVWQGGKNEVGSRKSVTMMWTPATLKAKDE